MFCEKVDTLDPKREIVFGFRKPVLIFDNPEVDNQDTLMEVRASFVITNNRVIRTVCQRKMSLVV